MTLGERIKHEREKNILSREDLGKLSSVPPIDIMFYEKGNKVISLVHLIRIVNVMPGVGAKLRILQSVGFEL